MNSLLWFACRPAFALPIKPSSFQLSSFHSFYPSDFLPCPTGGERASSCVRLNCEPGIDHGRSKRANFLRH